MLSRERADMLLRKAAQDEFVVEKLLSDPGSPDEMIGFHAQQAIEKTLKAVLASRSIPYRRTHDLVELIDLLRERGVPFPDELTDVRRLGPFAIVLRYDELPTGPKEPFDRAWAGGCVRRVKVWAAGVMEGDQAT